MARLTVRTLAGNERGTMDKHECAPESASRMREWIQNRGGVAIWQSANLSNPGASWSTPALTTDGQPMSKPTWQAEDKPARIITDAAEIEVITRREVARFHVAIRGGANGLQLKLTDGATRRVHDAVARAGDDAAYHFDYAEQQAVITVPAERVTLDRWIEPQPSGSQARP